MDQIFRHKVIKQLIKETKIVEYQNKLYIQTPFLCLTGEYQKTYVEYYKLKVSKLLDYNILTNFNTGLKVHLEYVYGIYPKEVKDGNLNEFCEITYIRNTYYNLLFFSALKAGRKNAVAELFLLPLEIVASSLANPLGLKPFKLK